MYLWYICPKDEEDDAVLMCSRNATATVTASATTAFKARHDKELFSFKPTFYPKIMQIIVFKQCKIYMVVFGGLSKMSLQFAK